MIDVDIKTMPDLQSSPDQRKLLINKVGVKDLRYPFRFMDKDYCVAELIGKFNIFVELPENQRGTHMSRFVEVLHEQQEVITVKNFANFTHYISKKFDSDCAYITLDFAYLRRKLAPISLTESFLDYKIILTAHKEGQNLQRWVTIAVPVTTLCPCSKKISQFGAHNQRSIITIKALLHEAIWLDDLIELAENQASCDLYGILKRPDEKYVTEKAYNNPKFVEDLVRDIALELKNNQKIKAFTVEVENFESIHNHSAYAMIQNDREVG
jgi:GTP cyclohydrolase I